MIRKATTNDSNGIKILKDTVWPDDSTSETHIQRILDKTDHIILINEIDSQITGFASAFITSSQDNINRWEIDLLAVHPKFHRQGIAKNLVSSITKIGQQTDADIARALVQIENVASQNTFAACGYTTNQNIQALYISTTENNNPTTRVSSGHLIPVTTLNYQGIWIEGELKSDTFISAQSLMIRNHYDIAGAVIPTADHQAISAAKTGGYSLVENYQWWIYEFK